METRQINYKYKKYTCR